GSKERSTRTRVNVPRHTSRHCFCHFSGKDDCPTMQQQAGPLHPAEWPVWPQKMTTIAGAMSVLTGVVVLAAWWFQIAIIVWPIPGAPAMVPNTASCFFFLGIALLLLRHTDRRRPWPWLGHVFIVIAMTLAVITLVEYATDRDLRIDDVFAGSPLAEATG